MKKCFAVLALAIIIILSGCYPTVKKQYEFRQGVDQIEKIEIALKEEYDLNLKEKAKILKTLNVEEHQAIVDALWATEGNEVLSPPSRGIGSYIIQITYKNGEVELIGSYNNGYITPEGKVVQQGYKFDYDRYFEIISQFLGKKVEDPTLG